MTNEQIGVQLNNAARKIASVLCVAIVAAQVVYGAGLHTGMCVHRLNDWLARAVHDPQLEALRLGAKVYVWLMPRQYDLPERESAASMLLEAVQEEMSAIDALLAGGARVLTAEELEEQCAADLVASNTLAELRAMARGVGIQGKGKRKAVLAADLVKAGVWG